MFPGSTIAPLLCSWHRKQPPAPKISTPSACRLGGEIKDEPKIAGLEKVRFTAGAALVDAWVRVNGCFAPVTAITNRWSITAFVLQATATPVCTA